MGSLETCAQIATVMGLIAPTVVALIHIFPSPKQTREHWEPKLTDVFKLVDENHDFIPTACHKKYLMAVTTYHAERLALQKMLVNGSATWYGRGWKMRARFARSASEAHSEGMTISHLAILQKGGCKLNHRAAPTDDAGRCEICFPEDRDRVISTAEQWQKFIFGLQRLERLQKSDAATVLSEATSDGHDYPPANHSGQQSGQTHLPDTILEIEISPRDSDDISSLLSLEGPSDHPYPPNGTWSRLSASGNHTNSLLDDVQVDPSKPVSSALEAVFQAFIAP